MIRWFGALALLVAVAAAKEQPDPGLAGMDCGVLQDAQEIVACAQLRMDKGEISKYQFSSYLTDAQKKLPSTHKFYGLGVVVGDSSSFVAGTMTHFAFDQVLVRIPFRLPVYGDWAPEVVMPEKSTKPLLVYSLADIQAPMLSKDYYSHWHNVGNQVHKGLVRVGNGHADLPLKDNCVAVLADPSFKWLSKVPGSAASVPGDRWCPKELTSDFNIFVGCLESTKFNFGGEQRDMLVMKKGWYKSGSAVTKIGNPDFDSVFLEAPPNKTGGGLDDDVVYREIPENYYQQWEQDFDMGYFVHQVMSKLARSAGAIVMDRFFFQNVMPRFLLPLVEFAKDWDLLRFVYIAIILANLMLNWAVGQLLGRLCVKLTYAYHLAVIVHNYYAPEVGFAALGAVFLLARELFFGTRNEKGEVQAAARFIPVAPKAPEVDWMWFMGVAQVAAAYGLDRAGEDGGVLYCTAMLTFYFVFTCKVPNAGGNSIWANIPSLVAFFMIMLLFEPFRRFLGTAMAERGPLTGAGEYRQQTVARELGMSVWLQYFSELELTSGYFVTRGGLGFLKSSLGAALLTVVSIDGLCGAGSFIRGATRTDRTVLHRFSAGAYANSPLLFWTIELVFHFYLGTWEKVAATVIGALLGAAIWLAFISDIWLTPHLPS